MKMDSLVLLLLLICPISMGVMMFLMMRGMRGHGGRAEARDQEEGERDTRAA
jgi:hypothetical protein